MRDLYRKYGAEILDTGRLTILLSIAMLSDNLMMSWAMVVVAILNHLIGEIHKSRSEWFSTRANICIKSLSDIAKCNTYQQVRFELNRLSKRLKECA